MTKPYALFADLHAHPWSAFSTTNAEGVNSRLQIIMDEFVRAATILREAGGDHIVFAGDLFHSRGAIDPEIFNLVHDTISDLCQSGFRFSALPGNHDLKGREATELGNAFKSFREIENFEVFTKPGLTQTFFSDDQTSCVMVPWQSSREQLLRVCKEVFEKLRKDFQGPEKMDLIIHAGIDGVLEGMPPAGLTPALLKDLGFKRVFAGHYHDHKVFEDGRVVSIGATTHQTWKDLGTRAGFLLVYPDRIQFSASHAPSFVEITPDSDEDEIPLIVDGNYVRVGGLKLTDAQINKMRDELVGMGAKGVLFQVARETVSARTGAVLKTKSLEDSVADYVGGLTLTMDKARVLAACNSILSKATETVS